MVTWGDSWPANVWIGSTVESQEFAEKRLPFLLKIPAAVRFLSCEPLLGSLDLSLWFKRKGYFPIDWVIAGGESGGGARPMHPKWAEGLLKQCQNAKVPFHFKQWGHWVPAELAGKDRRVTIQQFAEESVSMARLPKKLAGRTLKGETWNGLPKLISPNDPRRRSKLSRARAGSDKTHAS